MGNVRVRGDSSANLSAQRSGYNSAMLNTKVSLTRVVMNLYLCIAVLALLSVGLGMNLTTLARELGPGDPYQVMSLHEFSSCALALGILSLAFVIHRLIQRVAKLNLEQKTSLHST